MRSSEVARASGQVLPLSFCGKMPALDLPWEVATGRGGRMGEGAGSLGVFFCRVTREGSLG